MDISNKEIEEIVRKVVANMSGDEQDAQPATCLLYTSASA